LDYHDNDIPYMVRYECNSFISVLFLNFVLTPEEVEGDNGHCILFY